METLEEGSPTDGFAGEMEKSLLRITKDPGSCLKMAKSKLWLAPDAELSRVTVSIVLRCKNVVEKCMYSFYAVVNINQIP